jgi:hypothetical protein
MQFMERIQILNTPLRIARYAGRQLLGGAWAELPPLIQTKPTRVPTRAIQPASIQYYSTPEIPGNVELGEE